MQNEAINIRGYLPKGAIKEIAARSKVNYNVVALYFRGKTTIHEAEILKALKEYAAQLILKRRESEQLRKEILNQLTN